MTEKVPRLVAHVDVRKFKLDPMDGFLLTRIDGRLALKDLARETGLPEFSVERALEKLEKLGVIERIDPSAPPPPRPPPEPSTPPAPEKRASPAQFGGGLIAPKYDPKELDEPADMTAEQKKRILDYFYRLDDLDHYTLLGTTKEAEKKAIKRAYFELAGYFHPDRFYKKNLGSFKAKMEVLFTRITEAHDTLIDPAKRAEYDTYLAEVASTRGMETLLERAMAESQAQAHDRATAPPPSGRPTVPPPEGFNPAASLSGSPPPPTPSVVPASVPPAVVASMPPAPSSRPSAADLQARRAALAKRLTGGFKPAAVPKSVPPPSKPDPLRYSNPQDAVDALKRRYEQKIESATLAQVNRYIQAGEAALAKNDVVAAASSFSLATKFAPDDVNLAMRYQEVRNQADKVLCESYEKQASYEEKQQHWPEAARNWQKVAKIKGDDPVAHERAAHALLRCDDGDLHQAAEHAKQAIVLAPKTVANHITLIEVFVKAGLTASAKAAIATANQLDPKDPKLQELLKRIAKG